MSNRPRDELSAIGSRYAPPPIGPDGVQYVLERRGAYRSGRGLKRARGAVLDFMRRVGYGIAKDVPARLTSPCR